MTFFFQWQTRQIFNPWHPWHLGENITRDTHDKLIWNVPYFLLFFQVNTKFRTSDTPKIYQSYPWHYSKKSFVTPVTKCPNMGLMGNGKKKHGFIPPVWAGVGLGSELKKEGGGNTEYLNFNTNTLSIFSFFSLSKRRLFSKAYYTYLFILIIYFFSYCFNTPQYWCFLFI